MLAIWSDHNTRYLTIQITFPWQVCRQHIWRGRVNDRARENDYVHAPRNSLWCLCLIFMQGVFIKATCLSIKPQLCTFWAAARAALDQSHKTQPQQRGDVPLLRSTIRGNRI